MTNIAFGVINFSVWSQFLDFELLIIKLMTMSQLFWHFEMHVNTVN